MGDWPILCGHEQAFQGPPRTRQRIAARQSLTAKKNLFENPEVLLAAELGLWPWRLQEQAHGASARVPSRWEAQPGCWQRPHQLDNVELDSSNKAEAAHQVKANSEPTSVPTLGMSLPRLPFPVGAAVPPRRLIFFVENKKWDRKKKLTKIKFGFIGRLCTLLETCLQWMFWETSPNR